jgi:hypothetical protein
LEKLIVRRKMSEADRTISSGEPSRRETSLEVKALTTLEFCLPSSKILV